VEKRFTSCEEEESDHINENCDDTLAANEDEDDELKVGLEFNYIEEVTKYYKNYARYIGY